MVTPVAEREVVAHFRTEHEMSERRACQLLKFCRMTMRYASVKPDNITLRDRMKASAHERKSGGRKRALGTRAPMLVQLMPNQRWSLDFVSDQFTDCRRFRVLTVIDDCTRECLGLIADTSLSGLRVARELHQIIA